MTDALIAFLTARLDEDEAEQREKLRGWHEPNCAVIEDVDYECDCGVPARVLADVAAKRRIIELHRSGGRVSLGDDDQPESWRDYCDTCGSGEPYEYPTWWPCDTLRLLALPFADHPDCRPEWRPPRSTTAGETCPTCGKHGAWSSLDPSAIYTPPPGHTVVTLDDGSRSDVCPRKWRPE